MRSEEVEIERGDTLVRIVLTLLFALVAGVVEIVLRVLVAFSLIYALVLRKPPSQRVRGLANRIVAYNYRIYRYLTYNEPVAPFPFTDFPTEIEPSRWSSETTEAGLLGDADDVDEPIGTGTGAGAEDEAGSH